MRTEMRLFQALVCLGLILLAGCGGSGSSPGGTAINRWQYTALGDSLAVGILDTQGGGYVHRYRDYIASDTGATVSLIKLGINGAHSGDLLNSLKNDPTFRNNVSASQVVTWDIGGDDILHAFNLFQNNQC